MSFWYGGKTVTNDATLIPSFVYIIAQFTNTDLQNGNKKLAVFFDGVDFLSEVNNTSIFPLDAGTN
jgi:hypothetical protein